MSEQSKKRNYWHFGCRIGGASFVLCICIWLVWWQVSDEPNLGVFTQIKLRNLKGPIVRRHVTVGMTEQEVRNLLGEPDQGDPQVCVNAGPVSMSVSERIRLTPIVLNYRSYGLIVLIDVATKRVNQILTP